MKEFLKVVLYYLIGLILVAVGVVVIFATGNEVVGIAIIIVGCLAVALLLGFFRRKT